MATIPKFDKKDWPAPDEYLLELGRVSALWASLETQLDIGLGELAGFNDMADPRPFILVRHTSFPQKLDMLSALCKLLLSRFPNLKALKPLFLS